METRNRQIVLKNDVKSALEKIGMREGQNVIVHCSLSSIGFVCGGAQIIIESLLEIVGKKGTIVMPTQSWKNLDPETGVHWSEPKEWWELIRQNWPPYDKDITPTNTMGAVSEMFRKWNGSFRSEHPARSFCANGFYIKLGEKTASFRWRSRTLFTKFQSPQLFLKKKVVKHNILS